MIWRASVVLVWSIDKEYYPIIVGKVIPVSYTHLDVYKRQGYRSAQEYQFRREAKRSDCLSGGVWLRENQYPASDVKTL